MQCFYLAVSMSSFLLASDAWVAGRWSNVWCFGFLAAGSFLDALSADVKKRARATILTVHN